MLNKLVRNTQNSYPASTRSGLRKWLTTSRWATVTVFAATLLLLGLGFWLWRTVVEPQPQARLPIIPKESRSACPAWDSGDPNISQLIYSPDGQRLAVAGTGLSLRAVRTGQGLWCLDEAEFGNTYKISHVRFSPDGRRLAVLVGMDAFVRLYQSADGQLIKNIAYHDHYIHDLAISPDGRLLATAAGNAVYLWSLEDDSGTARHTLDGFAYAPNAVAFSPDGQILAVMLLDGNLYLYRTADWSRLQTFETGHVQTFTRLRYTPDGQTLVYWGSDILSAIRIADGQPLFSRREKVEGNRYDSNIMNAEISPDGHLLATLTNDWLLLPSDPDDRGSNPTYFSPGSRYTLAIWDTQNWELQGQLHGSRWLRMLTFTPDNQALLTDWEHELGLWELNALQP